MRQPEIAQTVVWALRSRVSRLNCVTRPVDGRIELVLLHELHEDEVAVRDTFADTSRARAQAEGLPKGLLAKGWREVIR